jgi:hypothetical protein
VEECQLAFHQMGAARTLQQQQQQQDLVWQLQVALHPLWPMTLLLLVRLVVLLALGSLRHIELSCMPL